MRWYAFTSLPTQCHSQLKFWHWKLKIGIAYLFMRQSCVSGVWDSLLYATIVCLVWPRSEEPSEDRTRQRGNELRLRLRLPAAACCMCLAMRHATHQLDFSSKNPPEKHPTSWPNLLLACPQVSRPLWLWFSFFCSISFLFCCFVFSGHREHDVQHHNLCCTSCTRHGPMEWVRIWWDEGGASGRRTSRLLHCKVQMGNDVADYCCCCATTLRSRLRIQMEFESQQQQPHIVQLLTGLGFLLWQSIVASCSRFASVDVATKQTNDVVASFATLPKTMQLCLCSFWKHNHLLTTIATISASASWPGCVSLVSQRPG